MYSADASFALKIAHGAGLVPDIGNPDVRAGVFVGRVADGTCVLMYFITGDQPRKMQAMTHGRVRVSPATPIGWPHDCFTSSGGLHCVGNGPQTEEVYRIAETTRDASSLHVNTAMSDGTPRITAFFEDSLNRVQFVIDGSGRRIRSLAIGRGIGYFVTAAKAGGLEPWRLALPESDPNAVAAQFWASMDKRRRIGLAAKHFAAGNANTCTLLIHQ